MKEFESGQCLLQTDEAILDAVRVDAERGELVETVVRTASRPSEHTHLLERWQCEYVLIFCTGFSSEIGTKLRDWADGHVGGSCYSQAALSSNDSKTR